MRAHAIPARKDDRLREAVLNLASEALAWAVGSTEDALAAVVCLLFYPRRLRGCLTREEKRAFFAELVVGAVGKHLGLRLGMILLGPVRERPGVFSFPVGARSFSTEGDTGCRCAGRRGCSDARIGGYKVLDAVLLRRRRGSVKTETLVWRVTVGGGSQTVPAEVYADREGALLDFYSG